MEIVQVFVPESLPLDPSLSQPRRCYDDQYFEPTQVSQPRTQNTQGIVHNSQLESRYHYWAVLVPMTSHHPILKFEWTRSSYQFGRYPDQHDLYNDYICSERRVSGRHCRFTLGLLSPNGSTAGVDAIQSWKDGEGEPEVWLEDLTSSNGTFINGQRVKTRRLLQHGDEISLGSPGAIKEHDVRWIFRSVGYRIPRPVNGVATSDFPPVGQVYERYQMLEHLGKGTFAEVRKVVDVNNGDVRALKIITTHRFAANPKTLQLFKREIDICKSLQHEHVCRLLESYEDPQHTYLVLEYVAGGDLLDYIMQQDDPGLSEEAAAAITFQICSAMAYTHSRGVTHRDLKPENILLTHEKPPSVKIADFGLAKMVHEGTMLTSMVGTPQYLAPEIVMQSSHRPGYENVVDSWSTGVIVFSMMTKSLPFEEDEELPIDTRIKSRFTEVPEFDLLVQHGISDLAIDFIGGLLAKDAVDRLTMEQALAHEWLAGPSSQKSQSEPIRPLGGDSMWAIETLDGKHTGETEACGAGRGQRAITMSATNYGSRPDDGSCEEFSQQVENMRLTTPAARRGGDTPIDGAASIDTAGMNTYPRLEPPASLPSPPLTNDHENCTTPVPPPIHRPITPLTPGVSMINTNTTKRKLVPDTGAPSSADKMFRSTSLSPAPSDDDGKNKSSAPDASAAVRGRSRAGRTGRSANIRLSHEEDELRKLETQRRSPRVARPRKSLRFM